MPQTSVSWAATDLPDLAGRAVVVTGATSGLGRATARALGGAGARVLLGVRDVARGREVAAGIATPAEVRRLDLADLDSVRSFATDVLASSDTIGVLVNNAGVMAVPERRTADGFELQIGTNHLGPFALTNLLLPAITDRVVTVSSSLHRLGAVRLDDLNWEARRYRRWAAYNQSKLANLLFTLELDRRLVEAGASTRAVAAHPGYASTRLQGRTENRLQNAAMALLNAVVAQSEDGGALPTLYGATQDIPGSSYVGPGGLMESRGSPTLVGRSKAAADPQQARELWALSERLTGARFPLDPTR